MRTVDAIVVGGGPAGSTCAWKLRAAGLDVLLLERSRFPRNKLCAGWITPEVATDLELDLRDYPASLMTFDELRVHWKLIGARIRSKQYSIRRCEFDDFLLQRANVAVQRHRVREIRSLGHEYVVDDQYRCKYLVGAGGTACPVYRTLFQRCNPRLSAFQTATFEQEFSYDWKEPRCHLWFFDHGLPGYAWYVPKATGYVNSGLGGMANKLKQQGTSIRQYWRGFVRRLNKQGLVVGDDFEPSGYSYYVRSSADVVQLGRAYVVGDAAGVATRDLCEGIGPAVKTGLLAADSIINGSEYSLDDVETLSGDGMLSRMLEHKLVGAAGAGLEARHSPLRGIHNGRH